MLRSELKHVNYLDLCFVAGFSAFMFVGAAGYTYKHGVGAFVLFTGAVWGYL